MIWLCFATLFVAVFALAFRNRAVLAVPQIQAHTWILYALKALHPFAIGAIIAQTASVATAHDLWHERECDPGPPAA
jgi:hypothetical protein